MKVLIIEDESVAGQLLKSTIASVDPDIEVVDILDSVESSVQYLSTKPSLDLIFLDIELGDGQTFDIFKKVQIDAPVIFVTAYQEHALKAFKLNSVDYLLKPVSKDELTAALLKYRRLHVDQKQALQHNILSLLGNYRNEAGTHKSRYLARNGTRLISIPAEEIAYFYTKDKLQYIKTQQNGDYIIDKRLDDIEAEVSPKTFFRLNRQFIVNYECIEKVHTWFSGKMKVQVKPAAYEEIIISRLKAAEFKKWLGGE
ncbi:LytTR family DNA-binding domain-containing protein [Chitinophaga niabensis]|uniref:LytR/AlgR family response regulator transcription factor n=1 Tax=Chitinophaga niabensis TaxID=536979 RepID=UPI0031B9B925